MLIRLAGLRITLRAPRPAAIAGVGLVPLPALLALVTAVGMAGVGGVVCPCERGRVCSGVGGGYVLLGFFLPRCCVALQAQ